MSYRSDFYNVSKLLKSKQFTLYANIGQIKKKQSLYNDFAVSTLQ